MASDGLYEPLLGASSGSLACDFAFCRQGSQRYKLPLLVSAKYLAGKDLQIQVAVIFKFLTSPVNRIASFFCFRFRIFLRPFWFLMEAVPF